MKIFLGADHGGFELKTQVFEHLVHKGLEVEDCGADALDPEDDYPQFAYAVATQVLAGEDDRGILICRGGQGMAMAANRIGGIRAAVIWDLEGAKKSREHNNANVLSIPADYLNQEQTLEIVDVWLNTKFSDEPRHQRRLDQIEVIGG